MKLLVGFLASLIHAAFCNHTESNFNCLSKYVIVDYNYLSQDALSSNILSFVVTNMTKLRNYHQDNYFSGSYVPLFPAIALAHIITVKLNATLINKSQIIQNQTGQNEFCFPLVLPLVLTHRLEKNVSFIWQQYYSGSNKLNKFHQAPTNLPKFSYQKDNYLNFYYCGSPKKLQVSAWDFTLFTDPFDPWIWVNLLINFILVTSILLMETHYKNSGEILMRMISSSMWLGTKRSSKYSGIFNLWMLISIIVVVFYSGSITSTLISPQEDDLIKTWGDLQKKMFTLLVSGEYFLNATENAIAVKTRNFSAPIRSLLQNSKVHNSGSPYEKLMFSDRVFNINFWVGALNIAEALQGRIRKLAKTSHERKRVCHVGQELIFATRNYFAFLPPENEPLFLAFQSLQDAGIVDRFTKEFYGMLSSTRVQDRVRLISRNKRIPVHATLVEKLKLQEETINIFLLWILCMFGSFTFFLGEFIFFQLNLRNTITIRFLA